MSCDVVSARIVSSGRREALGPEAVRACELSCPVFVYAAALRKAAVLADPMLVRREDVVRHRIDAICGQGGRESRCPLKRYRDQVVRTVLDHTGD